VSLCISLKICSSVNPPRAYHILYPYGHALGEPFRFAQQRRIVMESLKLLETIEKPGTIVDSPFRWKRDDFEEMEEGIDFWTRFRN